MAKSKKSSGQKSGKPSSGGNFRIAEAYRTIRTNLLFALANTDNHVVLFSSAEPSVGKSTLCSNLAIVMAQTGAKVLIIDGDMRKPVQHRHFHRPKSDGLSKILGGFSTPEDVIVRQVAPNVDAIFSGPIPPNPSELLGAPQMEALLNKARKEYDFVFVDMPPLNVVADALVLAQHSAGVVVVARQGQTYYEELQECLENIKLSNAPVLGVVITDVHENMAGYVGRQYYYRCYDYHYSR